MKKLQLLKTLVGSRAHGLHQEDSDYDYRGVHVCATKDILAIGAKVKDTEWIEGEAEDNTSYEIGHFLHMATRCHPNYLEVFKAPIIIKEPTEEEALKKWRGVDYEYDFANELIELFPYVWDAEKAFTAYTNYASNNRTKLLATNGEVSYKYAVNYARTIYNLESLLREGTFTLELPEGEFKNFLIKVKKGFISTGEIIDKTEANTIVCMRLKSDCKQTQDLKVINEFLLKIRKHYWDM